MQNNLAAKNRHELVKIQQACDVLLQEGLCDDICGRIREQVTYEILKHDYTLAGCGEHGYNL